MSERDRRLLEGVLDTITRRIDIALDRRDRAIFTYLCRSRAALLQRLEEQP